MAGAQPEQEPSIEEILASIRQIISDDEDQTAPAASAAPEPIPAMEPEPEPVAPPPPPPEPKEDILELKDPLPPPAPSLERPVIDLEDPVNEDSARTAAVDLTAPEPDAAREAGIDLSQAALEKEKQQGTDMDSILSDAAKSAALSGFSKLSGSMGMDRGTTPHVAGGSTLEDIVRDMLSPMLRTWLDANLPGIIEKLVQKELDKLARKAMDD